MDLSVTSQLAKAWVRYMLLPDESQTERRSLFEAYSKLDECVSFDPEEAWNTIQKIYALNSSDSILAALAAGPVEDLLARHGEKFIDRVEALAKSDAIFRKLLGGVWQNSMPDEIWKRLQEVAGPSF